MLYTQSFVPFFQVSLPWVFVKHLESSKIAFFQNKGYRLANKREKIVNGIAYSEQNVQYMIRPRFSTTFRQKSSSL